MVHPKMTFFLFAKHKRRYFEEYYLQTILVNIDKNTSQHFSNIYFSFFLSKNTQYLFYCFLIAELLFLYYLFLQQKIILSKKMHVLEWENITTHFIKSFACREICVVFAFSSDVNSCRMMSVRNWIFRWSWNRSCDLLY